MDDSLFLKKIQEITDLIAEKQKPAIEHRYKNMKAWRYVEECLYRSQGVERSGSYEVYKLFSLSDTPMTPEHRKKLLDEMTERERSLLTN